MIQDDLQAHRRTHTKTNSWWMNDARNIPLCRVCDECIEAAKDSYPPEVLGLRGRYEDVVEDPVEEI
jgi:hypothetical protein